ncbi:monothiol bacilliredoxin BrxC family protein, partial [Paenibacillus sp. Y412MC10]|uniref:monothiol bacilliredoxin BrxC family protein n=1 Tax=Geobacillus sp. (strain Y412MC10) TaxID=481743 RepID=UPI0037C5F59E
MTTIQHLPTTLQSSHPNHFLFFKHTTTSPITPPPYTQLQPYLHHHPNDPIHYLSIHLIPHPPLSSHPPQTLNIQHQSPQLILL